MYNTNLDPKNRNWTMEDIDPDPRFKVCRNECILTMCMFAVHVAVFICIYLFIASKVENWTYVMGMPLHLLLMILDIALFVLEIIFVVSRVFKDMDISPIGKILGKSDKEEQV